MTSVVKFQFTKFTDLHLDGKPEVEKYGYRIFDEYGQYCNDKLTLDKLKEVTPEEVVAIIEDEYDELYELVLDNGFFFNETWITVDEAGIVVQEDE